ncbi:cold-shock protein [Allorhizobium sp. BGMRC 0089]|uniref:cold-shock protein n=1 Tax=Allorhizobium sonneratiae TaxID=2934936 RepID=UPI0020339F70|nr:cold-shock protein [Allorhizobium sonneratiae]MCM2290818.1 cold-shock protein [Allorhizobium sonneratiae]
MALIRCRPGDTILLKPNLLRGRHGGGPARVIAILPDSQGIAQYRVRFQNETFDRNIRQDDIEGFSSGVPRPKNQPSEQPGSSWINPNSIRIHK